MFFLSEKNFTLQGSEAASSGEAPVKAVTDSLWLIDGHHDVYNQPELSKHRKHTRCNLKSKALHLRRMLSLVTCMG